MFGNSVLFPAIDFNSVSPIALEADLNASSEAVSSAKEKNDAVEYDLSEIERGMMAIPSGKSITSMLFIIKSFYPSHAAT